MWSLFLFKPCTIIIEFLIEAYNKLTKEANNAFYVFNKIESMLPNF